VISETESGADEQKLTSREELRLRNDTAVVLSAMATGNMAMTKRAAIT
jgi:hypothetical protein